MDLLMKQEFWGGLYENEALKNVNNLNLSQNVKSILSFEIKDRWVVDILMVCACENVFNNDYI